MRIVVCAYVVGSPLGGMTWHSLQYAMGLRDLGHDVWVHEDSGDWASWYDPATGEVGEDLSYGLRYAERVYQRVGLGDRWAYHEALADRWHGPAASRMAAVCADADVMLNVAGIHPLRGWLEQIPQRVFIDTDPTFSQVRHLTEPDAHARAAAHTAHFTFGTLVASGRSTVPDDGFAWRPTRQPIVLGAWPVTPVPVTGPFRTVLQWDSYAERAWAGRRFRMKSASFEPYADLPARSGAALELALGKPPVLVRDAIRRNGWTVTDPQAATVDPWSYQDYLAGACGEWSVAKHGYVVTRSGWFSERSACFLASGRPVILQDTGFSEVLPTGEGLLTFSTVDQAAAALETVVAAPTRHAVAAREVAHAYFDAHAVLTSLLDRAVEPAAKAVEGQAVTSMRTVW